MNIYSFLEAEIRRQIKKYLAGDISLKEFSEWFVGKMWDVEQTNPEETQQMVYAIDNALIQYSEDVITLRELRDVLSSFIEEEFTESYSNSSSEKIDRSRTNVLPQFPVPSYSQSEVAYV